jgi:hypothetical protein
MQVTGATEGNNGTVPVTNNGGTVPLSEQVQPRMMELEQAPRTYAGAIYFQFPVLERQST